MGMSRVINTIFFDFLFVCMTGLYGQESIMLTERPVRVVGMGAIIDNNTADARKIALRDAQRNAVEQILGTFVRSETKIENYQLLEDKIFSRAEGFIESFTVEEEGVEGTSYRVVIRAMIKVETLKDELRAIGIMLEEMGFPRIMLIVDETVKKNGEETVVDHPTLSAEIENRLLKKGFILVAKDYSDQLRRQERELMAEVIASDQKAAEMALSYGAEVVVVGTNTIDYFGVQNLFHQSDATASIRAIIASTAQVVANVQEQKRGGSDRAENSYIEASKKVGSVIVDNIIERIIQNWRQVEQRGTHFVVKLYGITSYRRQGMAFIRLLKEISDVSNVQQRAYGGGRLEVDLRYHKDLNALMAGIWQQMEGKPEFDTVDQKEAIGNNLIFEFIK